MVLLFYYLLDANVGMPLASWMGIGCAVVISVLAWLFKTTYDNMKKQIEDLQQRVLTAEERAKLVSGKSPALAETAIPTGTNYLINAGVGGTSKFSVTNTGKTTLTNVLNLKSYTVATLPTGTQGDVAYVTDALAPTFLMAVTGGGTVKAPVFYDGTNWVTF